MLPTGIQLSVVRNFNQSTYLYLFFLLLILSLGYFSHWFFIGNGRVGERQRERNIRCERLVASCTRPDPACN